MLLEPERVVRWKFVYCMFCCAFPSAWCCCEGNRQVAYCRSCCCPTKKQYYVFRFASCIQHAASPELIVDALRVHVSLSLRYGILRSITLWWPNRLSNWPRVYVLMPNSTEGSVQLAVIYIFIHSCSFVFVLCSFCWRAGINCARRLVYFVERVRCLSSTTTIWVVCVQRR